jgi:hypothetical protein
MLSSEGVVFIQTTKNKAGDENTTCPTAIVLVSKQKSNVLIPDAM